MFEVECPSCRASYQVDERRVPPTGLKMRCPKCGESFQVEKGGSPEPAAPVLGAVLGLGGPARSTGSGEQKATMLGMPPAGPPPVPSPGAPGAPPRPAPPRTQKHTMLGVAPAATAPIRPKTDLELESIEEVDLDEGDGGEFEAELPSARKPSEWPRAGDAARAPSARPSSARGAAEIDLPAMDDGGEASWDSAELPDIAGAIGLPAPAPGEVALPDLSPAPPRGAALDSDDFDLPDLSADLPDLDTGLPIVGGNLPAPAFQLPSLSAALPTNAAQVPSPAAQMPSPAGQMPAPAGRPAPPSRASLGSDALGFASPPSAQSLGDFGDEADVFGSGPLDKPLATEAKAPRDPSAFGEVNLGGAGDDEFDAFPTESAPKENRGGGPTGGGYGEVALEGGADGLALGEDVERQPAPTGPAAAVSAPVELPRGPAPIQIAVPPAARVKATTKIIVGVALLVAVAGGALSALPDVGPYGAYFVIDRVRAGANAEALAADVRSAEQRLAKDTAEQVEAAYRETDRGRADAPRFKARVAFVAYLGQLRRLRFGEDAPMVAEAKVLLTSLAEADQAEVEYLELARLAEKVADGGRAEVVQRAASLIQRGPEFAAVVGEAALAEHRADVAQAAFSRLLTQEPGARAHFGLARANDLALERDKALAEVDLVLQANPQHAGALLLRAELNLRDRDQDEALTQSLTSLVAPGTKIGLSERALGWVLLGELHLLRSRVKQAEQAFGQALTLQPGNARAQRGLADTLFGSGRYGEALARYEAASKADPNDLESALGVVQSKLRLEGVEDAAKLLVDLSARYPKSTAVAYWTGRAKEALGDREGSEKAYGSAIEFGQTCPELVAAYVALTRLLSQVGRNAEADQIIGKAEQRFPEDPEIYRALGELASTRGAFDDAIAQYDKALALDPKNIGLHFVRGVALRQARRFEDAAFEFDEVEKIEKDYPGLSLERGNLFEASGHTAEALAAYEAALAQAPKDPDLMLRVGCGKASAGQSTAAQTLLKAVLAERPTSAEVNFCMGVALLKEGRDLSEARRFLERAVGLDATRAVYHLYVGMAAIELSDYALAAKSLDQALELDRTLADAYWQRGVLRVRQGAVKDAEADLRRALELSPSRFEAHAALAEAYMQVNKEQEALVEWKAAVQTGHGEPFWYYRYGKLLLDNRQPDEAKVQLERAVELASKLDPSPPWLLEAHRNLALALGRTKEAIPHWEYYLDKAPKSSPYVREALRELKAVVP